MKLIHIFLFLNFAATLALGQDCYLQDEIISKLEEKLSNLEENLIKIATKYNSEYELEFMNWEIQHWFLDPVNNTYLKRNT